VEYEAKTNVHINWQVAPSQGMAEKRNLILASGNLPDVLMGAQLSREDQFQYGLQGILIPLNDLVEKQTVHLKKVINDSSTFRDFLSAPDGKIYSLGTNKGWTHGNAQQKMWVHRGWLEKVGMKAPTTTDEFYQMLKAFKETDCNGNGKADEIPLIGWVGSGVPMVSGYLMCAFVYNDSGDRLIIDKAGKISVAYNLPEWKEGLAYLRKLYVDKLMDPGSLTTSEADLRKIGENAEAQVIGACPGFYPGNFQSMAGERQKDYDVIMPLKGPNGVQLTAWNPWSGATTGEFAITKACKCPEVAMRWIDWFFTTEGGLRSRIGIEGKQWRWAKPEEKSVTGEKATWIQVAPINEPQNMFWGQSPIPQHFIWAEQASCEPILSGANCALNWRIAITSKQYEAYKPEAVVPPLWVAKADVARYSQLRTEINQYVNQSIARFIAGELNLVGDWDTYLKQLDRIGLADYLDLVQKTYDAKYKKS